MITIATDVDYKCPLILLEITAITTTNIITDGAYKWSLSLLKKYQWLLRCYYYHWWVLKWSFNLLGITTITTITITDDGRSIC